MLHARPDPDAWRALARFRVYEAMERKRANPAPLVKLHTQPGTARCVKQKRSFSSNAKVRIQGGVMTAVMLQGTASDVGKVCQRRVYAAFFIRWSACTAPFKSQNMALNSGITPDGKEMGGRADFSGGSRGITPDAYEPGAAQTDQRRRAGRADGEWRPIWMRLVTMTIKPRLREQTCGL